MSARQRFVELALEQLGKPVLWGQHGPESFDCSGLVTWALHAIGGKDIRSTHNAPALAKDTAQLGSALPIAGDLVFYGPSVEHIEHVGIWLAGGKCLSADGATSHILDLKTALANPHNRVRLHDSILFRPDQAFHAIHRNTFVDAIDTICL